MAEPNSTCSSCIFWRPDGDRLLPPPPPPRGGPIYGGPPPPPSEGDCILNPPTTYPVAREDGTRGLLSIWSRTLEIDTCGAYEPVPEADAPDATG